MLIVVCASYTTLNLALLPMVFVLLFLSMIYLKMEIFSLSLCCCLGLPRIVFLILLVLLWSP